MINIDNLSFAYKKKSKLFSDLNLNIDEGNIYGLLGKNGAGKTSLLKVITGLLFPGSGTCKVLGFDSKKRNPLMLSEVFFIPEEFHVPQLKIKEYLSLYSPFYPRFGLDNFRDYLNEFSLSENSKLTELSYGQKKKFLLSFGLAANTSILILDEPTNGLDIPSKSLFRKVVASSVTENKVFLISTHQVKDIQQLIDPVIILENGKILFHQSMTDVNEKLSVRYAGDEDVDAVYSEKVFGGYTQLYRDDSGNGSDVDLEILFNAAINNNEKLNSVFR